jgi:hypothetical protein
VQMPPKQTVYSDSSVSGMLQEEEVQKGGWLTTPKRHCNVSMRTAWRTCSSSPPLVIPQDVTLRHKSVRCLGECGNGGWSRFCEGQLTRAEGRGRLAQPTVQQFAPVADSPEALIRRYLKEMIREGGRRSRLSKGPACSPGHAVRRGGRRTMQHTPGEVEVLPRRRGCPGHELAAVARALVHRGGHHGRTRRRGGGARAAEVARWRCSRGGGGDGEVLAWRRRLRDAAAEAAAGRGGEARVTCFSLLLPPLPRSKCWCGTGVGEGLGFWAWAFVSRSFPLIFLGQILLQVNKTVDDSGCVLLIQVLFTSRIFEDTRRKLFCISKFLR